MAAEAMPSRRPCYTPAAVIASWCWALREPYLTRNLLNRGIDRPTRRQLLEEFARVWPECTATVGVQEPFAGTIRFKWLRRGGGPQLGALLGGPPGRVGG